MSAIRTLVIDDDFRVARIHAHFVDRTPGFVTVGIVHSGRDAVRMVQELVPDLVLLDIHLPDINGLDLLRNWRAEGIALGAIVITAAREAEAVRGALAGGAIHYIVKPFEYEDLSAALLLFQQQLEGVTSLETASQRDIDRIFGRTSTASPGEEPERLPKGLSPQTSRLVKDALANAGEMSATECADVTGISRVSVRRYLEHFVLTGAADIRLQYGRSGRPTRYYSLR